MAGDGVGGSEMSRPRMGREAWIRQSRAAEQARRKTKKHSPQLEVGDGRSWRLAMNGQTGIRSSGRGGEEMEEREN